MQEDPAELAKLLTVEQAAAIIDRAAVAPRPIDARLSDAAGHYLAADLAADRDQPPFDKSLVDGYAVRSADCLSPAASLAIAGQTVAGDPAAAPLPAASAVAIMTGAPLPPGADAVAKIEDVAESPGRVTIRSAMRPWQNVARRASDAGAGHVVLKTAAHLGPAQIAAAAAIGADRVRVFALPAVAVLTTGDEVVPADPQPHQIRDANGPMLLNLARRLGYAAISAGHVRDDAAAIRAAIESALAQAPVLLVSGGMSVGKRDFVPRVLEELNFDLRIRKLRIKPGKPFVFAVGGGAHAGKFVLGLPGNPVSAFVCTLRLADRLLRRLAGAPPDRAIVHIPLAAPAPPAGPREFYQPATLDAGRVTPLAWKGSGDIFTLAKADALIVRPENGPAVPAGSIVPVIVLP